MRAMLWTAMVLAGCATKEGVSACTSVCGVLFDECQLESFASFEECESSCAYAEQRGAKVDWYDECLANVSECNTYEIVECENEHGW